MKFSATKHVGPFLWNINWVIKISPFEFFCQLLALKWQFVHTLFEQTINYDFCLNKLLICCLLIISKVVVKLMDAEYVLYSTNKQLICDPGAQKQS